MSGEIAYARNGGVAIAYRVMGEGDVDLIFVPDYMSNLVFGMRIPRWRAFYESLAARFRLILFDKRGTGLSDHGGQFATLETRMEDMHAVLDAVGSRSTAILASHEGCGMAAMYAATYPERTRALVLFHAYAVGWGNEDPAAVMTELADLRERWGTQAFADEILRDHCPTLFASDEDRAWFSDFLRVGASPSVAYALNRAFAEVDLRGVLPAIRVPTMVLYRGREEATAKDVASRVPGAECVRVSGDDYLEIHLSPDIVDEVDRFVAGEPAPDVPETVLTTVMFTDIVDSTLRATELGDAAWRDLLSRHHDIVRRALTRFRGQERDTAGDGFFATFDGPARGIRCAQAIVTSVAALGLQVRVGLHIGECELHENKVTGMAVMAGARIAAMAGPGEVLASATVRDLVAGSGLQFRDRGSHQLKGLPGAWSIQQAT